MFDQQIIAVIILTFLQYSLPPISANLANLIINGDFESANLNGWFIYEGSGGISDVSHSGLFSAIVGSFWNTNKATDSIMYQIISIPPLSGKSAILSFYWQGYSTVSYNILFY